MTTNQLTEGYKIAWYNSVTETYHHGPSMMPQATVDAWVKKLNKEYPGLEHCAQWVTQKIIDKENAGQLTEADVQA